MTLGQRLRALREENKISRTDLAKKLKLSYWAVSKYETNERSPDNETLGRLVTLTFR